MFAELERINERPEPFEYYTASDLWTDEHTSAGMLSFHLDPATDVSSRNADFIIRSVGWITSRFQLGEGTRIADFGCGPGLYANSLAMSGAHVTGIDFSKRSVGYAKEVAAGRQLNVEYVAQNYLDFETEDSFDLIFMIMCDFCALSPMQRSVMLRKFQKLLKPGGSVLLDVYSLPAFDRRTARSSFEAIPANGFWSPEKHFVFQNTFKYADEKVVLDKYTIVESARTRTVYNWLQYFSQEVLRVEFLDAGLPIGEIYADVAGTPYDPAADEFAVIADKP